MPFRSSLLALALLMPTPTAAASLPPAEWVEGAGAASFSSLWDAPTAAPEGVSRISGTGAKKDHDILRISGLASGAWTMRLTVRAPKGGGASSAAGGRLLTSGAAFRHPNDFDFGKESFTLNHKKTVQEIAVTTPTGFDGDLWIALQFTHGTLDWTLDLADGAPPVGARALRLAAAYAEEPDALGPVVPLPPAILLLAGALGLGAGLRRLAPRD